MNVETALARLADLAPAIAAQLPAGRRSARMPESIALGLRDAGLFKLWVPLRFGGSQLSLPDALRVYQAAAQLDGSVGWSVMIGSGGGLFAAYLAEAVAQALFSRPDALVAGSGAPTGTARRVDGGYIASGRWRYASGAHYASVFTANCRIQSAATSAPASSDPIRAMSFAPGDVQIELAWDTSGLRATGSHDLVVQDVFVPEAASFVVAEEPPLHAGALYRLPFDTLTELPVCAVAVGVALRALALFGELAASKPAPGGGQPLQALAPVAQAMATARTQVQVAQAELHDLAERAWREVQDDRMASVDTLRACREGSGAVVRSVVAAVAQLVPLAGMNAIQVQDEFAVAWRDLQAVAAHYSVSPLHSGPDQGRY